MELPKLLPDYAIIAEIGVYTGESTIQFLETGRVKYLVAVDAWIVGYDPQDTAASFTADEMREAELRFRREIGRRPEIVIFKGMSSDVVKLFADETFDCVYIDANHSYAFVCDDIDMWLPKVKMGGILSGHDYCGAHPDVIRAVNEHFGKPERLFPDDSWMVTKQ